MLQAEIKNKLEALGIPYKEIKVYGSQIVVTCYGRAAADRFAEIIGKFATLRGIVDALDPNETRSGYHDVVRVFAKI